MPAYELVSQWDASIIFASRGCIRRCGFCSVPKLEGRPSSFKYSIRHLIYPGHPKSPKCCNDHHHNRVVLWDNNILGNPNWRSLFDELAELGLTVDFNQGLDGRLVTREVAEKVAKLKMEVVRIAYDYHGIGPYIKRSIECLKDAGINPRKIVSYTLFNYTDDPQDFFERVRDLLDWGAVCYPMRFEPLTTLEKNRFVSPKWTREELELVAAARRVIGYAGAFPPYVELVKKFDRARDFFEAFSLKPIDPKQKPPRFLFDQDRDVNGDLSSRTARIRAGRLHRGNDWRNPGHPVLERIPFAD